MYPRRSSALVFLDGREEIEERVDNLGRREARRVRREESWEVVNWAVGVKERFVDAVDVEVRKAREFWNFEEAGFEGEEVGEDDSFFVGAVLAGGEAEGERRDCNCVIRAAFWACVDWRARLSFWDSWRVRRRERMDSGVGEAGLWARLRF